MNEKEKELFQLLSEPFLAEEVKFKPLAVNGNRALALAYVDARVIEDRLDKVLGIAGWQDEYQLVADGAVVCRLRLNINGEWICKTDVGGPSEQPDSGDRMKAAFSDALKRTAVKFGIGRYLYRAPAQWLDYDPQKKKFLKEPSLPTVPVRLLPAASPAAAPREVPKTGGELLSRLSAFETKLGCPTGKLVVEVTEELSRKYGANVASWSGQAILDAIEAAKAFARQWNQRSVA